MSSESTSDIGRDQITECKSILEFLYLTPVGIIKFRPGGAIEMANPEAAKLLLPLATDGEMSNLYDLLANVVPDLGARVARFASPVGQICDQMQVSLPSTRSVLSLSINKIDSATLMAVIQDITRAIEQETRIRDDQQRFRAIFENIRDYAIYNVTLDGTVEEWNRSLNRLGGWEATAVTGAPVSAFFPPTPESQVRVKGLLEAARTHGSAEYEGWSLRQDRSSFWGSTAATTLPDGQGRPGGYVFITRDLTQRKETEDRLVTLAATDPLTGAANRRAGEAALAKTFNEWVCRRTGFSILMADIDHFKAINDRFGHDGGDEVLVSFVDVCRNAMRSSDMIFRWGGEEFLILLPGVSGAIARIAAERLRNAIMSLRVANGGEFISMTVSIGVTEPGESDAEIDAVLRRADRALYAAKTAGRNQVMPG